MCEKADILGATFDWRRRFKVSSVSLRRWHHAPQGEWNLSLMPARIKMKCTLNVWIACSAWLCWWLPRGTSLYCICCSWMQCLNASEASLSSVCFLSPIPAYLILLIIFSYALIISSCDLLHIGLTKI
jgi:hypothetical protein